ncbi:hypothetical protein ACXYN8_08210 [Altererythrobacter sp. CAU 1778]
MSSKLQRLPPLEQSQLSSASTLLQAYAQEMSFIATAATNAIKAVGEAQAQLARK